MQRKMVTVKPINPAMMIGMILYRVKCVPNWTEENRVVYADLIAHKYKYLLLGKQYEVL